MTQITALTRSTAKVRGGNYVQHLVIVAGHECWLSWQSFLLVLTMGLAAVAKPYERWSHPETWPFSDCNNTDYRQHHRIWRLKQELIANGLRICPLANQREVEGMTREGICSYRWNTVPKIDPEVFNFDLPQQMKAAYAP